MLCQSGFNPLEAVTTVRELELARAHRPDLILSDGAVQQGDGRPPAQTLRSALETAEIPCLVLTAGGGHGERGAGPATGGGDGLREPLTARASGTPPKELS